MKMEQALGHWQYRFARAGKGRRKIKPAKMEHPWPDHLPNNYSWVVQFIVNGEVIHEELAMDRDSAIEMKRFYAEN